MYYGHCFHPFHLVLDWLFSWTQKQRTMYRWRDFPCLLASFQCWTQIQTPQILFLGSLLTVSRRASLRRLPSRETCSWAIGSCFLCLFLLIHHYRGLQNLQYVDSVADKDKTDEECSGVEPWGKYTGFKSAMKTDRKGIFCVGGRWYMEW